MPDRRRHRGRHPQDAALFADKRRPALRQATHELCWLLERHYNADTALKVVGDHHQLARRQRVAVARSAVAAPVARQRREGLLPLAGRAVVVDGFNVLITVEAALSGGVILVGRDGRLRDLASVHGTWRSVDETQRALDLLQEALATASSVHWILDRPVSNSGRLACALRERGWSVDLHDQADAALLGAASKGPLLASADGPLIDAVLAAGGGLCDPVAAALAGADRAWQVDLQRDGATPG